jgi:hypothetical protein
MIPNCSELLIGETFLVGLSNGKIANGSHFPNDNLFFFAQEQLVATNPVKLAI